MKKIIAGLAPRFFLVLVINVTAFCLDGCAGLGSQQLFERAAATGMQHRVIHVDGFAITAFVRLSDQSQSIHIYIEGDGKAWLSKTEPSADPTPKYAMGLQLAIQDHHANVVYLARPCQFSMGDSPACSAALWTSGRFSSQAVDAMNAAVEQVKQNARNQPIELIGYSGGAAIAVLLAAIRQDVSSLRSVAGNLDHDALNRHHQVSLMPDSLNPADVASQLRSLPQIHFSGADDRIVPAFIARSFALKVGPCARTEVVKSTGHEGGWVAAWPSLLLQTPVCASK